jgi:hypothetical protein
MATDDGEVSSPEVTLAAAMHHGDEPSPQRR